MEDKITPLKERQFALSNGTSTLKLKPISLKGKEDLNQQDPWILVKFKYKKKAKQTKIQLEDLGTSDPLELKIKPNRRKYGKQTEEPSLVIVPELQQKLTSLTLGCKAESCSKDSAL
ncbi:hypothetical protein CIB84_008083 [Bambusicola thoracicus]|uniref:Uncharacterized protein n=1 Tax=Bambusicola thoracicus TaxID=9083 RepID=A0A2P4SVL2_BAMTH|nr:hypothetical protein CIB84_008083 [Bambusicola thoracicus]